MARLDVPGGIIGMAASEHARHPIVTGLDCAGHALHGVFKDDVELGGTGPEHIEDGRQIDPPLLGPLRGVERDVAGVERFVVARCP